MEDYLNKFIVIVKLALEDQDDQADLKRFRFY